MNDSAVKYDVAIIGSGIGGSTLATVLARQGYKVDHLHWAQITREPRHVGN